VVTLDEYLDILERKIIEKENVKEIKESKRKEREGKQKRRIINEGIIVDRAKERSREKDEKVEFIES
jgi:hypothetical protein